MRHDEADIGLREANLAEEEEHDEIQNYAQDRVLALAKHIWMLKATLD